MSGYNSALLWILLSISCLSQVLRGQTYRVVLSQMHAVVLSRLGIDADWTGIIQWIESSFEWIWLYLKWEPKKPEWTLCFLSRRSRTLSFLLFYTEHTASPLEAAVRNQIQPWTFLDRLYQTWHLLSFYKLYSKAFLAAVKGSSD